MTMEAVESTNIAQIGYDEDERILRVKFNSGETWEYDRVPEATYKSFRVAHSPGNYFAVNIKGKFPATRV